MRWAVRSPGDETLRMSRLRFRSLATPPRRAAGKEPGAMSSKPLVDVAEPP